MYKTYLFSDVTEVNGDFFRIFFLPDFRQDVAMYFEEKDYYVSEGQIKREDASGYTWISIPESASWFLEVEHWKDSKKTYGLYITCKTREIKTPLGKEFNRKINDLVKQARINFNQERATQLRLYFYNSQKERLSLVEYVEYSYLYEEGFKYRLSRPFHYCSIDRIFGKPDQDCFVLGRVNKTIGTKNGYLHDFIEPVYNIFWDFEKNEDDFFDNYYDKIMDFQGMLFTLLCFTIKKKHSSNLIETKRVVEYETRKKEVISSSEDAVKIFISEINEAFKNNNIKELRNLYKILNTMQDCSKSSFSITTVHRNIDTVFIKYENGEQQFVNIAWIENNKNRCINYGL